MKGRQCGSALLLVLWVTMLLAAILVGVAATSRSQSEATLFGTERIRAELAAEAGLAHAVAGLRAPDIRHQWVPDGRPYGFGFDGAKVTVRVVDVSGLIDLNASSPDLLRGLFQAVGMNREHADQLADAIVEWRGGTPRVSPGAALPSQAPQGSQAQKPGSTDQPHGPFRVIDELARVPGMTMDIYDKIEPAVTVFSGRNFPDASYATPLTLAALQGIDVKQAKIRVEKRRKTPAQRGAGNGRALGAVNNGPLVAGYGGVVERVFSTATMPDGTRVGVDATIRLALTGPQARPYKVLDWRAAPAAAP